MSDTLAHCTLEVSFPYFSGGKGVSAIAKVAVQKTVARKSATPDSHWCIVIFCCLQRIHLADTCFCHFLRPVLSWEIVGG